MLPKAHRLASSAIPEILRAGKTERIDGIDLRYVTSPDSVRFAVVVPKSADKRATVRNRMKRMISEAIRLLVQQDKVPGISGVVFIRRKQPQSQRDIAERIARAFDRIRL